MQSGDNRSFRGESTREREAAERLAIDALTFIAADPVQLERFMALSGLSVGDLREAAAEPGFFSGVLDFIASDEALLLTFAANGGRDPSAIAKARQSLAPPEPTF
jgi:Protein of unknown function (DUF3572)